MHLLFVFFADSIYIFVKERVLCVCVCVRTHVCLCIHAYINNETL